MARKDDCLPKTTKQHKQTTRRKSIMKYGKIVTLTLAATVLVAMAGANAFAATSSFSGQDKSTLSSGGTVSWNSPEITQTITSVPVGNNFGWTNVMVNNYGATVNGRIIITDNKGYGFDNIYHSINAYGQYSGTDTTSTEIAYSGGARLTVVQKYEWGSNHPNTGDWNGQAYTT